MVCAVVVAAGRSVRMGGADKNGLDLLGKPVLRRSLEAFEACGAVDGIVLVAAAERVEACRAQAARWGIGKLLAVVCGGETRGRSVMKGLAALPENCGIAAIHDGARPFVTDDVIGRCVSSARERGSGVAAVACRDTVKAADGAGRVTATPDRAALRLVQTPQTFRAELIRRAYQKARDAGVEATDDAAIAEWAGEPVYLVEGSPDNIKITTPEDIAHGEAILRRRGGGSAVAVRVGEGYDVHRLVKGRAFVLGGVEIPHETGLLGHSDADVLVHAVMDALLGAAALGDIGAHFPDTDDAYRGASSLVLLEKVSALLAERGWAVGNVDATVAAQRPKLAPHIPGMRENIARRLGVPPDAVSVKATTTERMGFEGREEGVSARAVVMIFPRGSQCPRP